MISHRQYSSRVLVLVLATLSLSVVACSVTALNGLLPSSSTPSIANPDSSHTTDSSFSTPIYQPINRGALAVPTAVSEDLIAEADAEELLLVNIYQRVSPAVVNIEISIDHGEGLGLVDVASGSGFVIDPTGYIVTNNHVIQDAAEVRVTLADGTVLLANVVGADPYSDIAVLHVTPPAGYELVAVELGNSDNLLVGQRVIAIGNPFGLSGTMTVGIVSAVGRTLPATGGTVDTRSFSNPLIIQTDAAINPGNSGGPLLDSHGRVVGVNTAIRTTTGTGQGVGFAVPVNTVSRVAPQLIATGTVDYPYMGISSNSQVSLSELATEYDLPTQEGVLIAKVFDGTAAAEAGLQGGDQAVQFRGFDVELGGDIIVAINSVPIASFDELIGYLVSNTSVGDTVTVTYIRDGEVQETSLVLGSRND